MKRIILILTALLSLCMTITGCSNDEFADIKEKLKSANFLVKASEYDVEFALGAEEWVVEPNEVQYFNVKIAYRPYSITNKKTDYEASEESVAYFEDNYKKTLDKYNIDLDTLSAYGNYLINSYDKLRVPEEEDDNEFVYKIILNPKVVVTKETWKEQFPNIVKMLEGEKYDAYVENEDEINFIDEDYHGWLICFQNFEFFPLYKSPNFEGYYNIKRNSLCNYMDLFEPEMDNNVEESNSKKIQQEYSAILEKYGVTFEELEKFANFALDHYYETDQKIETQWEQPDYLPIYSGR